MNNWKVDEAARWLKWWLVDKGHVRAGIVKQAAINDGIGIRPLERAVKRAGVKVTKKGFPSQTYWELDNV